MVCGGWTSCQSDDHSGSGEGGGIGLPPSPHGQRHHSDASLSNEHSTKTLVGCSKLQVNV